MTTPENTPAPEKGTPEYNEMMAQKYENQGQEDAKANAQEFAPTRPENVPEKFWDAKTGQVNTEALLASYAALETKQSQGSDKAEDNQAAAEETNDDAAREAVAAAGLDWQEVSDHIQANDFTLSSEHREALNKSGIPDEIIDGHLELLRGSQELALARTVDYAGGQENLNMILQKATTELAEDEIKRFNELLAGPNWKMAIDALGARFIPGGIQREAANGQGLFSQFSGATPGGPTVAFQSQREQNEAINKRDENGRRLYDIDPAYRAQVRQRIAASQ